MPPLQRDYRVVVGVPRWELNGVSVFSANLVRGLRARDVDASLLVTEEGSPLVTHHASPLALPPDLAVDRLPVPVPETWGGHWQGIMRYLEDRAPCVWIPNHDWRHSIVSSRLPASVGVVGVMHSDDPLHYDHVARLGRFWDAVVCVSPALAREVASRDPDLGPRLTTIPIGVPTPAVPPVRSREAGAPLRVVYHGVLGEYQKRILDIPRIVTAARARGVPLQVTIAGGGPDEGRLREACASFVADGTVRFAGVVPHETILTLLGTHDVFLMTSAFEGMPNALLEAMAQGCVPLVSRVRSGIPDVVSDGVHGLVVDIGDIDAYAARLAELHADGARRARIAAAAHARVREGGFRVDDMVERYLAVFDQMMRPVRERDWHRPSDCIAPPPQQVEGIGILPGDYRWDLLKAEWSVLRRRGPATRLQMVAQLGRRWWRERWPSPARRAT